jgi:hypothetical protein
MMPNSKTKKIPTFSRARGGLCGEPRDRMWAVDRLRASSSCASGMPALSSLCVLRILAWLLRERSAKRFQKAVTCMAHGTANAAQHAKAARLCVWKCTLFARAHNPCAHGCNGGLYTPLLSRSISCSRRAWICQHRDRSSLNTKTNHPPPHTQPSPLPLRTPKLPSSPHTGMRLPWPHRS